MEEKTRESRRGVRRKRKQEQYIENDSCKIQIFKEDGRASRRCLIPTEWKVNKKISRIYISICNKASLAINSARTL